MGAIALSWAAIDDVTARCLLAFVVSALSTLVTAQGFIATIVRSSRILVPRKSNPLFGFLHIERRYLTHPTGVAFLASDYEPKRSFRRCERVAVPPVSKNDNAIREIRIQLGQRENDMVSIGCADHDIELHPGSPELLA